MHRFFVSPGALSEGELILREAQAHQVHGVLRLHPGEIIVALDNTGREYRVELVQVSRALVRGRIVETLTESREARTELTLYQGLLKADKFEWILQKGTELGVAAFVPLVTERVIASDVSRNKRARWERILVEAAEQSGRTRIPRLADATLFAVALKQAQAGGGCALIPWEGERAADLRTALCPQGSVHLFIGPEGGLSAGEIEQARSHAVQPITLGPRILRAETAGLVAASAILFARGEMDAAER
ncbi:MAG: RsmE family RNA methyltransferase [Anaerolineae bacterium]